MAQKRPFNCTVTDDTDLRCAICWQGYVNPKRLPCFHTFCLNCLETLCGPAPRITRSTKPCPLCRTKFDVPLDGPKSLPDNEFIRRILLEKDLSAIKKKLRNCDPCVKQGKDEQAEYFCFNCKENICSTCKEYNSEVIHMKLYKIVNIRSRPTEEELAEMKLDYCNSHGREIEFYCRDCEMMLCCACLLYEHKTHDYTLKKNISDLKREAAAIDIDHIEKLSEIEEKKLQQIKEQEKQISLHALEARREIRELCHQLQSGLQLRKYELLNIVDKLEKDHKLLLESRKGEVEPRAEKLNGFLAYSKLLMERGTDSEIIKGSIAFHQRSENLVQWFENNGNTQDDLPEKALVIQINKHPDLMERLETLTCSFDIGVSTAKDVASKYLSETSVQLIEEGRNAAGVTVVDDQLFVIKFQTPSVTVYDSTTLEPRPSIHIPNLKAPTYITGCPVNKLLYISDSDSRYIHRVELADSSVRSWNCLSEIPNHHWIPLGLSVTSKQTLLVSGVLRDGEDRHMKSKLVELSSEGKLVKDIQVDQNGGMRNLWHTVSMTCTKFILCHGSGPASLHRLCTIGHQGGVIKTYGAEKGRGEGQLFQPTSVSVDDKSKLIFLADQWNHRVLIFNSALILLGEVQVSTEIKYPSSIFFDSSTKKLFVCERYTGKVYAVSAKNS